MKQIKVTFHHKNYLHPFKLSINYVSITQSVNYKTLEKLLKSILKQQLVLSKEEEHVFKNMSISILFIMQQDYIQSFVEQYNRSINDRINIDYLGNGSQEYFQFFQNRLVKFIQSQGRKLVIKNQKEEDEQNNEIIQDHLTIKEFMSFSQFINRNFFSNQNQQQFSQIFIKENSAKNNGKFIKQWKINRENIKQSENDQQQEKSRGFLQEKYQRLEIMQQLMEKQFSTFKQLLTISLGYFYILYDQQIKKFPSKVQADDQKKNQNIQKKIFIIKVLMCNIVLKIIERYQKVLLNMKNIFSAILSESQDEQYLILNEQSNSFSQNKSKNLNVKMKTIFIKFRQHFQKIQTSDIKKYILISTKESDRQSKNISNQKTISSSLGASFYSNFINKIMDIVSSTVNLNLKVKEVESCFFQQVKQNQMKPVKNLNQKKILTPISWLLQNIYNLENSQIQNGQPQVKLPEKQVPLLTIIQTITKKLLTSKNFQNPLHKLIMVLQSSHNISTVSKIIKLFYFIYNEAIKDFSQLLYFITETIRYDLSKIFKNIDQKIRERAYKLSDSEIVYLKDLNFFLDFDGSLNLSHYSNNQRQFYSNLYFGRQFEPFRLKQAIKTQKMKEDVFLKICKSTLKDLKFLIQKYTQYKSGKIVHNDKNHSTRRLSKLQAQLIQSQRRKFSSNQNYYDNSLQKEDFTIVNKGRLFVQVGINVNLDLVKKQRKNSLKSISSRKNSIQFQNLVHAVFQKQQQLHRISQKIQQTHNQHNKNNEILKSNNETLRKIYQENSQLIKINQWYEEQLRLHQDKQTELEKTISELIDINRKRDELKHRFKVQSLTVNQIIFPSQNQGGRFSKDSNRTRRRSSFNGRFLKDLTKISPQNQKHNDFILPALPHTLNAANYILPPPPPLISSFSLPPPPPLLQLTPPPLPPFLNLVPPPLLHQGLRKSIGKNSTNKKNQHQFKTVGWNMVDLTSIRDSFWQEVGEVQFNKEDLIKNFSKKPSTTPVETFKILQQKKQKKTLLKPDRVKNIQIGLKKVKLTYKGIESLQNIVYEYDQNYLQIDKIECLLNILPTQQQKQSYSEILVQEGTQEQWTLADFFLLTISKIESYQERLKAIRFKLQFVQTSEDFFIKINNLKDFLIDLRTDQFLQVFLEYMLNIGNFLNSNSNKGGAYGFRLQSIPKTYSLIGQDKSTSLFDFILKALSQKNLTLFNSLKENQKSKMIVSINILEQDLNSYIKDCAAIQQIIIYSRKQGDNSSKYLLPFYISCQEEINIMKKIVKQVKQIFEDILSFYCEKMECEELINFIKDFRNRVRQYMKKNKLMGSGGNNNFRFSIA